jgi:hypothetical protein
VVSLLLRLLDMHYSVWSLAIIRTISTRPRLAELSSEQVLDFSSLGMVHVVAFLDLLPVSHLRIIEHRFKLEHHRVL